MSIDSILGWFRKGPKSEAKPAPPPALQGAPGKPRWKTWQAANGYVVQYLFRGYEPRGEATAYHFTLSADRKNYTGLAILLSPAVSQSVEAQLARTLKTNEWFGLVKLEFFRMLDACPEPANLPKEQTASAEDLLEAARTLQFTGDEA